MKIEKEEGRGRVFFRFFLAPDAAQSRKTRSDRPPLFPLNLSLVLFSLAFEVPSVV